MKTKFKPGVRVIRKPQSELWLVQTQYTLGGPIFTQESLSEENAINLASRIRQDLRK